MRTRIGSAHVAVIESECNGRVLWTVHCLTCGKAVSGARNPLDDGYLVWFRARHFECTETMPLSPADALWLRHATCRIRAPRRG